MNRIGSLCTGYGGLDMAVERVLGGQMVWYSEFEKHPSTLLAQRFPDVPNIGDLTEVPWDNWKMLLDVDILTGGYPCQPFSQAGKRLGEHDPRHLWPHIREAIRVLRPRLTFLENVAGHRSKGFSDVLRDCAEDGLDVRWVSVRASDVGAPHQRERLFFTVTNPKSIGWEKARGPSELTRLSADGSASTAADTNYVAARNGQESGNAAWSGAKQPAQHSSEAASSDAHDSAGDGEWARPQLEQRSAQDATDAELVGRAGITGTQSGPRDEGPSGAAERGETATHASNDRCSRFWTPRLGWVGSSHSDSIAWGDYEPAIRRWEAVLGRPAPVPTEPNKNGRPRLAAAFDEWMMGLPAGWITDVDIPYGAQIKLCGNGVVPQQAELALRLLLDMERNG